LYLFLPGEISLPTPRTNEKLKEEVKGKIRSEEINIGQLIVPKNMRSLSLQSTVRWKKIQFFVERRKMPLDEVCERQTKNSQGSTQTNTMVVCPELL